MKTWREEAAVIIARAVKDLPINATLAERQAAVDAARPSSWSYMSWPQKAWQAARRDYLCPFGYQRRRKQVTAQLPLFENQDLENSNDHSKG